MATAALLIDKAGVSMLYRTDQAVVRGQPRYYYAPRDPRHKVVVVSHGDPLELRVGQVVKAKFGWESGWHGKCHPAHDGLKLTKITLTPKRKRRQSTTLSFEILSTQSPATPADPRAPWARQYGFSDDDH